MLHTCKHSQETLKVPDHPADLSDELAECAVQRFSEANFSRITNKNGFFMGIIRRVKQDGPDRSGGDLKSLPRPIRHKLQDLIEDVSLSKFVRFRVE